MLPAHPQSELPAAELGGVLRTWGLHLIAFSVPLYTLAFVTTGPHSGATAAPWLVIVPVVWLLDKHTGPALHQPVSPVASWAFDAILVALAGLQVVNVVLALRLIAQVGFVSLATPVMLLLVGIGSGFSAIVVAHELVHRPAGALATLGRLLLCTVCYEHFSTEHVRGHHARVGTDADPATARFGETFEAFFRRTVPGQFRSAWRLECKRLGDEAMPWRDPRLLRSRVLHGVLAEVALAGLVAVAFGASGLVFFLVQSYLAVRLLEAVNYFEHYGLRRLEKRVRPIDSWDSDSWFTLFALVGLSRHADHHAHAARPFQSLRAWDESPKLPHGYIVTTLMVLFANRQLRGVLQAELERRQLGPFAPTA